MSNINIKRAVENIRSGTTVYTPVVELIVNAIQAIRTVKVTGGLITVTILRSKQVDLIDKTSAVDGFIVRDNGIGFNQDHRDSFDTLYTDMKAADGGKGFGRFSCLKYFDEFTVDSIFSEGPKRKRRTFAMGRGKHIIIDEKVTPSEATETGATITISGVRSVKFPDKGLEIIARVLVEKLLPYFIDPNSECPRIVVEDGSSGSSVVLNDYLSQTNRQIVELEPPNRALILQCQDEQEAFHVRVFKFYSPRANKSKISLVAHRREVAEVTIQTYIPEFAEEFYDKAALDSEGERDRNYIIKAYVFGDYLDNNVSLERGAFNFQRDNDLIYGISQSQVEQGAALIAQAAIGDEITQRKERKNARIKEYIDTEAPWHRALSQEADFTTLPMRPSSQEIEMHLQTAKFKLEMQTRAQVREILSSDDPETLRDRVAEVVDSISQTSKNDLIHYVSMRKCVLDLFEKSLETDEEGKHRSEGDVHDIIMPRRKDTESIDYEQHNLWILDERLNFTGYVSSDRPLDGPRSDRTDVTIFGKRIAFRGDNVASNPITIFEFKKPQRHDFANPSSDEDPVQQIVRYVNEIRDGKYKTPKGRDILVTNNTPFYGYVVCDLSRKIVDWLEREKDFTPMPDQLGYFKWYGNIKLYIEVLSWTKIHQDADMRNKIFFHKLGI
ncbi:sensor histidine kinase [Bradyrhizobium sp. WSM 1738]|uniref:ATP-binding protein n=1 Tax=Bradyrhizobium hereditatis TaxID=2821405 RepID=UPI001CE2CB4C|nr:ATP-binding protein [Bradyrhizobium hereditatis]MCA6116565.1 sensor histidine kinase [Bradyrhizobium hereditatis]